MREAEPRVTDPWALTQTTPTGPSHWPGSGIEYRGDKFEYRGDGFEIDRKGAQVVAGRLVDLAVDTGKYSHPRSQEYVSAISQWALPRELSRLMGKADEVVKTFWGDLYAEVGMAGLLIDRAAANYKLGDDPRLGDLPLAQLDQRILDLMPDGADRSGFEGPSRLYPNNSETIQLPASVDYGVGQMTAMQAIHEVSYFPDSGRGERDIYEPMFESLVELARTLLLRAQDLRDAPWRGAAADVAQNALRQIYANANALAATVGSLFRAAVRFVEVIDWCRWNFQQLVQGGAMMLAATGDTLDGRARSLLEEANEKFYGVYDLMPKRIVQNLPGLMVTEVDLIKLYAAAKTIVTRPKNTPWLKAYDAAWQREYLPVLKAYGQAEETYG
ncbi:hypothetical protein [Nonomuraea sp. NPDC002799]